MSVLVNLFACLGLQKAQRARQDAAKRKAAEGKGGGGAAGKEKRAGGVAYKCVMCMVRLFCTKLDFSYTIFFQNTFPPTMRKDGLIQHVEGKHPKSTFEKCFPTYADSSAAAAGKSKKK